MPQLVTPSNAQKDAFLSMARDWLDHGNDRYRLALDDFPAYLATLERRQHAEQLPESWVPSAEFWLADDAGHIVACGRLRFWLTPALEVEGGHIGYDVRPSRRRYGFGTTVLRLLLPEAQRRGLTRVRVTADADNLPSIRVIERNGGRLSGEVISEMSRKPIKQYWIELGAVPT